MTHFHVGQIRIQMPGRGLLAGVAVACLGTASIADASITGVCPDGSMFIVQRRESIPCPEAKTVDPNEMPPIKPHYLPRPYGWEAFNRRNDPNNPYNLIGKRVYRGENVGRQPEPRRVTRRSPIDPEPVAEERLASREEFGEAGDEANRGQLDLGLGAAEVRDLASIVELSQRRAPASIFARGDAARVRLARSAAFEERLHRRFTDAGVQADGPIVLFVADGQPSENFYGNFTFVQGHIAYHPKTDDPLQVGLIRGRFGSLSETDDLLGYVVLPAHLDLSRPLDIYWNDRQVTTTLQP